MMNQLVIEGKPLSGQVRVSGAKNAVLKLMAATLMGQGRFVISNVPDIADVHSMAKVLRHLGAEVGFEKGVLTINVDGDNLVGEASHELVREMRASIQVMGPRWPAWDGSGCLTPAAVPSENVPLIFTCGDCVSWVPRFGKNMAISMPRLTDCRESTFSWIFPVWERRRI